ncbi:MAG: 50S ribosomal protein L2 [Candidatus Micrarchaeota archaeon]
MGTRLTHQKRGKGSPRYSSLGHRYLTPVKYSFERNAGPGEILGFADDPGRHALVTSIMLGNGKRIYNVAQEGLAIGDKIKVLSQETGLGFISKVGDIPEGTNICNVEITPGDGGKIARAPGSFCQRLAQDEDTNKVQVQLKTKKVIKLNPECLATIGIVCGGGKNELPFMKAGTKRKAMRARNKLYPKVRGRAMSAYDHPYGGKTGGKSTTIKRSAPPGRKAGHIAARTTGRRKGKAGKV